MKPSRFSELNREALIQECESLSSQLEFHQRHQQLLPVQVLRQAQSELFYVDGCFLGGSVSVYDFDAYIDQLQQRGKAS